MNRTKVIVHFAIISKTPCIHHTHINVCRRYSIPAYIYVHLSWHRFFLFVQLILYTCAREIRHLVSESNSHSNRLVKRKYFVLRFTTWLTLYVRTRVLFVKQTSSRNWLCVTHFEIGTVGQCGKVIKKLNIKCVFVIVWFFSNRYVVFDDE